MKLPKKNNINKSSLEDLTSKKEPLAAVLRPLLNSPGGENEI